MKRGRKPTHRTKPVNARVKPINDAFLKRTAKKISVSQWLDQHLDELRTEQKSA